MHLATLIANALEIEDELIRAYGLLHDIGHLPFSHEAERALEKWVGNHEALGWKIVRNSAIWDILTEKHNGKKIREVFKNPRRIENAITSSDLGADRMDYLIRDNRNTGVAYGTIDVERIITQIGRRKNRLYINEGGVVAAESLLIGRHMMFCSVYLHHTVRIISAMLVRAIRRAVEYDGVDPKEFVGKTDMEAIHVLKESPHAREMTNRILKRRLYKRLRVYKRMEDVPESILKKVDDYKVILDKPYSFVKPVNIMVKIGGMFRRLDKVSPLVSTLSKAEEEVKTILIIGDRNTKL